jgi:hypothetical protein
MRTPEKASGLGAFALPRNTKPRRYDYGGAATFHFGGYRPGLRLIEHCVHVMVYVGVMLATAGNPFPTAAILLDTNMVTV